MSFSRKLLRLIVLAAAVCLPAVAARSPYPSPEDQIHRRISAARVQAGYSALERRDELDALARNRAAEIAARPADKRLSESMAPGMILQKAGIRYRRALERRILLRNIDQVSGVMEKWKAQATAWRTATTAELDAAGYGTAQADDGWIVFVAILVRDLAVRDSPEEIRAMEQAVLERINAIRTERGLAGLKPVKNLAMVARTHSRNMVDRDFLSHSDPLGTRPAGRVKASGIDFQGVAENITMNNHPDAPAVQAVQDWMDSPGHRRNILNGDFRATGIGLAVSDDGRYFFTQLFLVP
ncbi:MAG: CAP domain-containing protein [Acidobacteria bacterium]|uniref:CAP domain-containing protein n=1 Tax=Candidatus Polarisedimenticola svalbardensis TaxID=2886004 RepID=A0A8J7CLL1_9BACT|nr:CAP domain-containing protein [Candidatus Polarisedimenticola svalbardensis]